LAQGLAPTIGAYARFEEPSSIDRRGNRAALSKLGQALKEGKAVTFDLEERPAPPGQELTSVSFKPLGDPQSPVTLDVEDRSLIITGGATKAALLGGGLINLSTASLRVTPASVPTHLDVEYYEGHYFMGPSKNWMTVFIDESLS